MVLIKRFITLCCLLLVGLGAFFVTSLDAQEKNNDHLKMISLRIVGDDNRLRIVTVFNQRPDYRIQLLKNPTRIVIDMDAMEFVNPAETVATHGLINAVRYGATGNASSRIILHANRYINIDNARIGALDGGLWQLIIDIEKTDRASFDKAVRQYQKSFLQNDDTTRQKGANDFRVVIDAGHGGIDSGAKGLSDILEKNVTLAFARSLRDELERTSGLDVFLTRDSDVFLRLNERVQKARAYGADLFISIHADTINVRDLRGATVYTLSDKASDDISKLLAERENKADLLDGLPPDEQPEIADILIDLTRRETHSFSVNFADSLISNFKNNNILLINNPHRYAGFQVLKAPDVPSVLIEIGYLSNNEDEKLITNPQWRKKMAASIASSVRSFADYRAGRIKRD